jgi:hypothetical protein
MPTAKIEPLKILYGVALRTAPFETKETAFTLDERREFRLEGLLLRSTAASLKAGRKLQSSVRSFTEGLHLIEGGISATPSGAGFLSVHLSFAAAIWIRHAAEFRPPSWRTT